MPGGGRERKRERERERERGGVLEDRPGGGDKLRSERLNRPVITNFD